MKRKKQETRKDFQKGFYKQSVYEILKDTCSLVEVLGGTPTNFNKSYLVAGRSGYARYIITDECVEDGYNPLCSWHNVKLLTKNEYKEVIKFNLNIVVNNILDILNDKECIELFEQVLNERTIKNILE